MQASMSRGQGGRGPADAELGWALPAGLWQQATNRPVHLTHSCSSYPAAALLQEKKSWLEKLRAAEGEAERCRSEAAQLRLQQLQLGPAIGGGGDGSSCSMAQHIQQQKQQSQGREEQLLQWLLGAQAAEAALRAVLCEAREEQVAACKALSSELRRVHALERLRVSEWRGGVDAPRTGRGRDAHMCQGGRAGREHPEAAIASSALWLSP